ncbi:MAG: DinB family protein [Bacteroidia bacterium]|nr:DinB family protein [Bacteroidia bacterium]
MQDPYLIWQLEHQHEILLKIVSDENSQSKENDNKWTVREIICHLGAYQEHFSKRIDNILLQDNPKFDRYKADDDPNFSVWKEKVFADIISHYFAHREKLNNFLSTLNKDQLNRTANHPLYGDMKMTDWIQFFILHENHHIFSIFRSIKVN